MKKIAIICMAIVCIATVGCGKRLYPNQSVENRKNVPRDVSYFTRVPSVKQIGDVKYIHDISTNSFTFFRGKEDSILDNMRGWLPTDALDEETMVNKPVAKFITTNIAPYTLFTRKELKRYGREIKQLVIEMNGYKTNVVTIPDFTYLELLSKQEQEYIKNLSLPSSLISTQGTRIVPPVQNQQILPPVNNQNRKVVPNTNRKVLPKTNSKPSTGLPNI